MCLHYPDAIPKEIRLGELMDNVKEAIELYLTSLTEDEKEEPLQQRVVVIQKVKTFA